MKPHSDCIWDIAPLPQSSVCSDDLDPLIPECSPGPEPGFITCSSDGTVRIWHLTNRRPASSEPAYDSDTSGSDGCPSVQWLGEVGREWEAQARVINVDLQSNLEFMTPPEKPKKGPEAVLKPILSDARSQPDVSAACHHAECRIAPWCLLICGF